MNAGSIHIVIAEPSLIIRNGLAFTLRKIPNLRIQVTELEHIDQLQKVLVRHNCDILIINPSFWGNIDLKKIKAQSLNSKIKTIALCYSVMDHSFTKAFDSIFQVFDSAQNIFDKIYQLTQNKVENDDNNQAISTREEEIICLVAKGMTNKEIAEQLIISPHTVLTHRKNIARKLEIHSAAGLTIYAIVNKLVKPEEVNLK
jgi:DNA-binding NarL/FixJ family response regulator